MGSSVPAPAPAAAATPSAKPAVVGTPTFCLLVKNMFDPATETDEGWELDIKEEMEEVCIGVWYNSISMQVGEGGRGACVVGVQ